MANPLKGKSKREIMIYIGQSPWGDFEGDDLSFDLSLTMIGKETTKLNNTLIENIKDKINTKYLPLYKNQLRCILANLIKAYHNNPDSYVFYSRDTNYYQASKRYNPNGISYRPIVYLVDNLIKNNWLKIIHHKPRVGNQKGKRSRIALNTKLLTLIKTYKLAPRHIHKAPIDVVRLKDDKKKFKEYNDTDYTKSIRHKLFAYNILLNRNKITLYKNTKVNLYLKDHPVNYDNKNYFRVFSDNSFQLGGRFYGPWWVSVKRSIRDYILINGHKTVELDYGSLNIHLLYSELGINYYENKDKDSDPYILTGVDKNEREVNKTIINIALNHTNPRTISYVIKHNLEEENLKRENSGEKKLLKIPKGKEIQRRIKIFIKDHPHLQQFLFSGVSLRLQFKDSCIAESIIDEFIKRDIPILTIHDSFIVQHWNKSLLYKLMDNIYREHRLISVPKIK